MTGNRMHQADGCDDGVSFLETLIVLAITVIMSAGIGIPAMRYIERARETAARAQIETFRLALETYYLDCACFPDTGQGLEALVAKPVVHPVPENWKGPYLDRNVPSDPWGKKYRYLSPGGDGFAWRIVSNGPDRSEGGSADEDNICSWK